MIVNKIRRGSPNIILVPKMESFMVYIRLMSTKLKTEGDLAKKEFLINKYYDSPY